MKIKTILRITGSILMFLSMFMISSCTKSADESITKDQKDDVPETAVIGEMDFTESDEDLLNVDYKEFYEQLSPHGEWIEVDPAELGLSSNTAQIQFNDPDDKIYPLSSIFGIKDANAAEVNESKVFVWKPSVDLGVSVPGIKKEFTPYTNGQWINSDAGWYFKAPTPAEETVSHYGRWVNSPTAGWLWVPGRVWAPAWVDWKQNDDYVSWAPLPPSVYLNDNVIIEPVIKDKEYVIVERKFFLEPDVYKYNTLNYENGNTVLVKDLKGTDGIVVINNVINNVGPDIVLMQKLYGRNIEFVKLHHVKKHREVMYSDGAYYVYSPEFRKFKNKGKRVKINMPESYKEYDEWITSNSGGKGSEKEDKKTGKDNNNGNMNNGDKHNGNNGNMNNGDMHNGNNGNKDKEKNDNMNNGNDNGKKNNDKDNGNKSNNNNKDKGNKDNGKNNGKGKK